MSDDALPGLEEPELDDPETPTPATLGRWLEADRSRKVAVLAPDAGQARTWAEARAVPANRYATVRTENLYGLYGPENVIVRLQGPGGNARTTRQLNQALARCQAAEVWVFDDVIPMEAEAQVSQTIGGAELTLWTDTCSVLPRAPSQGDTFVIAINGEGYNIPRAAALELVEVIQAWHESRPYVDAAAAQAAAIREAVLAGGDPFAIPPPKP